MPIVVKAPHENQRCELRLSDIEFALSTGGGRPGCGNPAIMIIHTQDGTDLAGTLDSHYYKGCGEREGRERDYIMHQSCNWDGSDIAPTLTKNNAGGNQRMPDKDNFNAVIENNEPRNRYVVRRLTPLECCRLQGFPDDWCEGVPGSDSAQYKMWGNGMALPNAVHVVKGIVNLIKAERTAV